METPPDLAIDSKRSQSLQPELQNDRGSRVARKDSATCPDKCVDAQACKPFAKVVRRKVGKHGLPALREIVPGCKILNRLRVRDIQATASCNEEFSAR